MKLEKKVLGACIALVLPFSTQAMVIDTFEDLGADGSIVSSRTIDGVNVTLDTNIAGVNYVALTYGQQNPSNTTDSFYGFNGYDTPLNPSNVSGSRFISTFIRSGVNGASAQLLGGLELTFYFSETVQEFGFTSLDVEANTATLTAYDINNQVIDSQTVVQSTDFNPANSGIDIDWLVATSAGDISYAVFSSGYTGAYGIDDMLVTSAVPIPASIWLFGSGLLGLLSLVRRNS